MRPQISNPSLEVTEINVPEVSGFTSSFTYNYYEMDEMVNDQPSRHASPEKSPRYILLTWDLPKPSIYESVTSSGEKDDGLLEVNQNKIISEKGNFSNPDYLSHFFGDVSDVLLGIDDLENYSKIKNSKAESVAKMSKEQLDDLLMNANQMDKTYQDQLPSWAAAFSQLSNFPSTSLGLQVMNSSGDVVGSDNEEFGNLLGEMTLGAKINKKLIPDIFRNLSFISKNDETNALRQAYQESKNFIKDRSKTYIDPISLQQVYASYDDQPVKYLGYIIDRHVQTQTGFVKDRTYYVDGVNNTNFYDYQICYGKVYSYYIRLIVSSNVLCYASDEITPALAELFFSSAGTVSQVECFEYVPPPPPETLKFYFDYSKNNLLVTWEPPTNPQGDIVQYQVMRRKSIKHPFELISQYCFDKTYVGTDGVKFLTQEIIDGNNPNLAPQEFSYLIKNSDVPVYVHRDEDFVVDTEFFESSTFIYAVCSVDAHGMISNYSTQYHVTFDVYKNKIVSKVICDLGSPRPYPNMNLKLDAFKDTIRISGQATTEMHVHFTPEQLRIADNRGVIHKVVEAVAPNRPGETPYYLIQMINLDNQKSQLLRINIKDPDSITTT